ncbi:MAG: hypothetical protein KF893_15200 [Caldilineaceae bacterium]|nr:hypothetical protein [Caldilineaceae bacterium]
MDRSLDLQFWQAQTPAARAAAAWELALHAMKVEGQKLEQSGPNTNSVVKAAVIQA